MSDPLMYLPCMLSQVSRVDELLWALAADLEERWLVSEDQPSHLWALLQCASICKVRPGPSGGQGVEYNIPGGQGAEA